MRQIWRCARKKALAGFHEVEFYLFVLVREHEEGPLSAELVLKQVETLHG